MKRLALAVLLAASPVVAQSPAPSAAASPAISVAPAVIQGEYELLLDEVKIDCDEGKEFPYQLANGTTVKGKLTKRKLRTFAGEGVSFTFSGEMQPKVEKDTDLTTITLDHSKSPMAIVQVFPAEVSPDNVPAKLLEGIKNEFKDKNAKQTRDPADSSKKFKQGPVAGKSLQYQIGGQTVEVEVYAWAAKGRTIAVTLQWATEEDEVAKAAFQPLLDSLESN